MTTTIQPLAGGTCPGCGFVVVLEEDANGRKTVASKCPECATKLTLTWVYGEHSDIPCDGRCMGAVSHRCSCSCGGRNHRRGYLDIHMVPMLRERDQRSHAAKVVRREAKARRERQTIEEQVAAQLAAHPVLTQLAAYEGDLGFGFLGDMRTHLLNGKLLSDRQAESASLAFTRMVEGKARREREAADRAAKAQALRDSGVRCPTGRHKVQGEIIMVRTRENAYGYGRRGLIYSALVRTDAGWTFWTTLPQPCLVDNPARNYAYPRHQRYRDSWCDVEAHENSFKGLRIEIAATFAPDGDEPLRGRASRPVGKLLTLPENAQRLDEPRQSA